MRESKGEGSVHLECILVSRANQQLVEKKRHDG